ncbi:DoxX family protein [Dactylosporangium roseum]|uniref:DoxX family protein n=1 Tax=Dactylosporangium roseum TaxID=47989 RepID=A0ABY5YY43_9ACTN|nr:DoxX family protein [Dactylosporangium roseum]UWZ34324.1 DoxX family protein [Dactylosporangium roseum]
MIRNGATRFARGSTARRRAATIASWSLQLLLAAQFAAGGLLKLAGDAQMVDLFDRIGAGQWMRYLVGVLELAGAAGLLVPRLAAPAALALAGLMVGALVTNLLIGINAVLPAALLLAAGVIVCCRRDHLSAWSRAADGRAHSPNLRRRPSS